MRLFAIISLALAACTNTALPEPTGATCDDPLTNPLTWDSFGQQFMATYCTSCHSITLTHAARNGAPLFHDYDSLKDTMKLHEHIDAQAGIGPKASNSLMPPDRCPSTPGGALDTDCPKPSDAERAQLATWLACEVARP